MILLSGIQAIVTDIEGTTSSLSFVKDVLFPYARAHIPAYVHAHEAALGDIFAQVREHENNPTLSVDEIIALLLQWIDEDRKITPLKTLQGQVWEEGFKSGAFKGHIYDDAAQALQRWHDAGLKLYVYSSGSVAAQKLLYGYSEAGDLTPLFSGYFDTVTGGKREAESYAKIAVLIGISAQHILFLSDITAEVDAARAAGFQTLLIDRESLAPAQTTHPVAQSFDTIQFREIAA